MTRRGDLPDLTLQALDPEPCQSFHHRLRIEGAVRASTGRGHHSEFPQSGNESSGSLSADSAGEGYFGNPDSR
nr:hypothetical protein KPHV_07560 [Kitasatospora purpeofusca]